MIGALVQACYIAAAAMFILSLKWLSSPKTARRGVGAGEMGMLLAIGGTLLQPGIESYTWIAVMMIVGVAIGAPMAIFMPMTAVPQRTALSHAFGAAAAALVGTAEYYLHHEHMSAFTMGALGIEVLLGALTFTGSLMAFGKLQEILPTRPIVYRGQNIMNLTILGLAIAIGIYLVVNPGAAHALPDLHRAVAPLRCAAHPPDRRRGHAHGDRAPQLVRGSRGVGDGLRARTTSSSSSPARSTDRRASSSRSSCARR